MDRLYTDPQGIEARSFEIIRAELGSALPTDPSLAAVVIRVIHTTADFGFAKTLRCSPGALPAVVAALRKGAVIVTDTKMAEAGIDKTRLSKWGGSVRCFISDSDVAEAAKRSNTTRAVAAVDKAAAFDHGKAPLILAVGNAPTALFRIGELIKAGTLSPAFVIGVPVGFVNVVESKEALIAAPVPFITFTGRKGGSTVAAAICNALLRLAEQNDPETP
jgi:precorrin-8X/cobalt-precorrin-8 methylmutase